MRRINVRRDFEKWAEDKGLNLARYKDVAEVYARGEEKDYYHTDTYDAWIVWQAAWKARNKYL